jgi:hypothetical protein
MRHFLSVTVLLGLIAVSAVGFTEETVPPGEAALCMETATPGSITLPEQNMTPNPVNLPEQNMTPNPVTPPQEAPVLLLPCSLLPIPTICAACGCTWIGGVCTGPNSFC